MSNTPIGRRTLLGAAGLLAAPERALAAGDRPRVRITTNHGTITVVLEDRKAPLTCANFLRYVDAGGYDGGRFFRAAKAPWDPTQGQIVGTTNPRHHPIPPGTISLGRFEPGSATCNFFICASPQPYLDAHPEEKGDNQGYAAFGQVVSGLAVVKKILSLPANGKTSFPEQKGQWLDPPVPILGMKRA